MVNRNALHLKVAVSGVLITALAFVSWVVMDSIQDTSELSVLQLAEKAGVQPMRILPDDCMPFLGRGEHTDGAILEFPWLGTREQYDHCWRLLVADLNRVQYTPMIRVATVSSDKGVLDSAFSSSCEPYWSEVPEASDASDRSKVYAWTGTGLQHAACMFEIRVTQESLERLQSGDVMRPDIGTVIRPPESSLAE